MEELFFAVQPIFWEGKIGVYQLSLFVMVCIFIYGTGRIIQYKKEHKVVKIGRMSIPEYAPIDPEDSEFALKTLGKLKELIGYFYAPEHSDTHTVREIGKYLFDSSLIETASRLEHAIYTGKKLSNDECKKINITIKDFINRSKKNIG